MKEYVGMVTIIGLCDFAFVRLLLQANLVSGPPAQTLSRSHGETQQTFLHGCEIKSGREAWVRG